MRDEQRRIRRGVLATVTEWGILAALGERVAADGGDRLVECGGVIGDRVTGRTVPAGIDRPTETAQPQTPEW